jgi:hypothetical protein
LRVPEQFRHEFGRHYDLIDWGLRIAQLGGEAVHLDCKTAGKWLQQLSRQQGHPIGPAPRALILMEAVA